MISVTDPIQRSIDWTKKVLFQPFDLGTWCVMGFASFLAALGSGGGGNFRGRNPFKGGHAATMAPAEMFSTAREWVLAHLVLVAAAAVALFVIGILLAWISSRGQFVFLESVVTGKAAIAEPWRRHRRAGNSLFLFRLGLGVANLAVLALAGWAGWKLAGPGAFDGPVGLELFRALLGAFAILLPAGLVLFLIGLVLRDFVVPVMYIRGCGAAEGYGLLWREVIRGNGGSFVLFYFLRLVLALAAGIVVLLGSCLTCCVAALPYVSSVVFLPIAFFFRSYPLHFMGQCGEAWRLLPDRP
ncbi:DUF7544 domain-containing protein [Mesoterricola sediminis]|uniref:DUF4013 domain-containing protein n=1 Tax=Mesoterricola sediminis TaxID=2927980 RepID=A0AA48GZ87_9BACT|nr:hypothetical protein [Mesoterricola sediminis]BDU78355.1 hypothetical protein METESE_33130 [Mesoterricola sediminis]